MSLPLSAANGQKSWRKTFTAARWEADPNIDRGFGQA
jgi:hypothetical protein